MFEEVEGAGAAVPADRLLWSGLGKLISGKRPALFAKYVGERMCADLVRALNGYVSMLIVKTGFTSERFHSSLD